MTLSQYYHIRIKELVHHSWNEFCANPDFSEKDRTWLKKQLKAEYKKLYPKSGYKNDPVPSVNSEDENND